jgi:hypothetical protein
VVVSTAPTAPANAYGCDSKPVDKFMPKVPVTSAPDAKHTLHMLRKVFIWIIRDVYLLAQRERRERVQKERRTQAGRDERRRLRIMEEKDATPQENQTGRINGDTPARHPTTMHQHKLAYSSKLILTIFSNASIFVRVYKASALSCDISLM